MFRNNIIKFNKIKQNYDKKSKHPTKKKKKTQQNLVAFLSLAQLPP